MVQSSSNARDFGMTVKRFNFKDGDFGMTDLGGRITNHKKLATLKGEGDVLRLHNDQQNR